MVVLSTFRSGALHSLLFLAPRLGAFTLAEIFAESFDFHSLSRVHTGKDQEKRRKRTGFGLGAVTRGAPGVGFCGVRFPDRLAVLNRASSLDYFLYAAAF